MAVQDDGEDKMLKLKQLWFKTRQGLRKSQSEEELGDVGSGKR